MERCAGCGIETDRHPVVGVGAEDSALAHYRIAGAKANARGFVPYSVCRACHSDPGHRRRVLKMTFFERGEAASGLAMAGSASVSG